MLVTPATVHIIDDDDAVRDSLVFLASAADLLAASYAAPTDFLDVAGTQQGCVVTDVRMPGMDGLALTRKLREMGVEMPVIMMTGHGDIPLAVEAMKIGVADFIEKPFDDEQMLLAIRRGLEDAGDMAARAFAHAEIAGRFDRLSRREREVLSGLVEGKGNKVIALDLKISPRTVEIYRANLMTKLQATSLSELIRQALVAGIV